jgi:predicted dehydrogenase
MKKLAIAGCGGMIYDFIYEYTKTLDLQLEAVSGEEPDLKRFAGMYAVKAKFSGYAEMLDAVRPDLVIVYPSDETKQAEMVKAALLAGADVLCERPVCHSVAEGEELIAVQKKTGRFVMPRYNRRYMNAYISAKHIMDSPEFGFPYMYSSGFHAGAYGSEEKFISNHISHHLDLARMLLGEIKLLHARRITENDRRVGFNIVFESAKPGGGGLKTLGNIQSNSFLCGDYPMERLDISGNLCQIVVENVRTLRYSRPVTKLANSGAEDFLAEGGTKILNMNYAQLNNFAFYGFENMLKEFVRCSEERIKPAQDMEDALESFRLTESLRALVSQGAATGEEKE